MHKLIDERYISMDIFLSQIDKIIQEEGWIDEKGNPIDKEFDKAMGWQNNLYRWRKWQDEKSSVKGVTIKNLVKISQRFNKSLDWLAFGKDPCHVVNESQNTNYEVQASVEFDTDMLAQISLDADDYLKKVRLTISHQRKKRWLNMLFEYWLTHRLKPDEEIFKNYLTLTHNL